MSSHSLLASLFAIFISATCAQSFANSSRASTTISSSVTASSVTFNNASIPWITAGTAPTIPGLAYYECAATDQKGQLSPCTAVCPQNNQDCIAAARSEASTCSPQWSAYQKSSSSWASRFVGTGKYTTEYINTNAQVVSYFTSLSTDNTEAFEIRGGHTNHPVYAFGSASLSTSYDVHTETWIWESSMKSIEVTETQTFTDTVHGVVSTITTQNIYPVTTGYPVATPVCSAVDAFSVDCGGCVISGGSVEMFYWPVTSSNATITNGPPKTAIVDGITMTSPSVYISLQTIYARDNCGAYGGNYSGSIIAMNPQDVSSVYGDSGAAYSPDQVTRLNFADLQGVVPASVYEEQNACGNACFTIYNDYYRPTLAIPPQVRSLDPSWGKCALNLRGVYDPPKALQPASSVVGPSTPVSVPSSGGVASSTPAAPVSTPSSGQAASTSIPPALPESTTAASDPSGGNTGSSAGGDPSVSSTPQSTANGNGNDNNNNDNNTGNGSGNTSNGNIGNGNTGNGNGNAATTANQGTGASQAQQSASAGAVVTPNSQGVFSIASGISASVASNDPAASNAVVIDGTTLTPGQALTLDSGSSLVTVSVFTSNGVTEVALGTSTTEILGGSGGSVQTGIPGGFTNEGRALSESLLPVSTLIGMLVLGGIFVL